MNSTKMTFFEKVKQTLKDKQLSDGSINLYLRNLKKLNNDVTFNNLNFLKKPDEIMNKIKDLKDNTQRGYLIAIVSTLKAMGDKYKGLYKKYYKLMINIHQKIKEKPTEEMTETQKANWMNWDDVLNIYKTMGENLKLNKVKITEEQYNDLLNFVLLSLYVLIPPRRNLDWLKMMITFNSDCNDKKYNYLDLKNEKFIFNVFKTVNKDGILEMKIPADLMKVINIYIKYHPLNKNMKRNPHNIPLLVEYDGTPINKINSITRMLNKIFHKKIGASMLRHSYLSSKYGGLIKEQEKDAKLMSHNLMTQKDYIKL
jgi:integrase